MDNESIPGNRTYYSDMIYLIELCSEPVWVNNYLYNSDSLRK